MAKRFTKKNRAKRYRKTQYGSGWFGPSCEDLQSFIKKYESSPYEYIKISLKNAYEICKERNETIHNIRSEKKNEQEKGKAYRSSKRQKKYNKGFDKKIGNEKSLRNDIINGWKTLLTSKGFNNIEFNNNRAAIIVKYTEMFKIPSKITEIEEKATAIYNKILYSGKILFNSRNTNIYRFTNPSNEDNILFENSRNLLIDIITLNEKYGNGSILEQTYIPSNDELDKYLLDSYDEFKGLIEQIYSLAEELKLI